MKRAIWGGLLRPRGESGLTLRQASGKDRLYIGRPYGESWLTLRQASGENRLYIGRGYSRLPVTDGQLRCSHTPMSRMKRVPEM